MKLDITVDGLLNRWEGDPNVDPADRVGKLPLDARQREISQTIGELARHLNLAIAEAERLGLTVRCSKEAA